MNRFLWHHRTRLTDREIELLLSGSPEAADEHADLKRFLTALADERLAPPPHDAEYMATALASVARSSVSGSLRNRPRRAARRMVALATSFALLFAMSGIALGADDAAPGDLLYGIDRAFELIGIGDGGIEERIAEFQTLIARGDDEMAFEFLEEVIESSNEAESSEAQTHLNVVADAKAQVAEDNVAEHQRFIDENEKGGVGVGGKDFGQGVADIVRNRDTDLPEPAEGSKTDTPAKNDKEIGPPDDAGRPDDAGPPAEPPPQSNSDNNQSWDGDQDKGPPPETGSNSGSNKGNGNSGGGNGGIGNQNTAPPDNAGKKDK